MWGIYILHIIESTDFENNNSFNEDIVGRASQNRF